MTLLLIEAHQRRVHFSVSALPVQLYCFDVGPKLVRDAFQVGQTSPDVGKIFRRLGAFPPHGADSTRRQAYFLIFISFRGRRGGLKRPPPSPPSLTFQQIVTGLQQVFHRLTR